MIANLGILHFSYNKKRHYHKQQKHQAIT